MVVGHHHHRVDRDLWMSKARWLQLRLRERFRVAVEVNRSRPVGEWYFRTTFDRWIRRFRSFRSDSLASSSALYRRRVSRTIYPEEDSVIIRLLQAVAVPILGNVCHVFMTGLNRVQVYGVEKLHEALLHRPKGRPLITVSNHVASMDDPLVISALLPPRVLMEAHNLRWTLCATDRCFKNSVTSAFFRCVKVLPVSRGDGVYQKGLDMAVSKLNNGGWVHIFPEGSRSRDGGRSMGSAKRGVGRLVLDADSIPIVVPFVHTGMQEVVPIGATLPRVGKTVTVLVGDPIHFDDLLHPNSSKLSSRESSYDAVSSRIGERLQELKAQADKLALEQSAQTRKPLDTIVGATGALEQVDWELFGMSSHMISHDETNSNEGMPITQQILPQILPRQEPVAASDRYIRVGCYGSGIVSRIQRCIESTELKGYAAANFLLDRSKNSKHPLMLVR
ncbi:Tafazzin-like protein [Drosera capensis]